MYRESIGMNMGITLCEMTIRMMQSHMKSLEQDFVTNGGIRERMTAARLGARASQKEIMP